MLPSVVRFTVSLAVIVFALWSLAAHAAGSEAKRTPNVVFILVDDLGWTDVGSFGSGFYKTPNVDRLAREGMRFENAYSACTVCSPTRAAVMTGFYPARTRVTDWITGHKRPFAKLKVPDWTMQLEPRHYNLAEAFRDAGYATAHVGKWHLGQSEDLWPEKQGFDVNVGGWSVGAPQRGNGGGGFFPPYLNPRLTDGPSGEYLDDRLAREAVAFIEENRRRPFFLNLWLYTVHTPLQAAAEKIAKYRDLAREGAHHRNPTYAAMVEHMDDAVGAITSALDRLGLKEDTIVILTSDNGGLIGNRGDVTKPTSITSNFPLRTGKGDVYEGGVRVPLIVRWPGKVSEGSVSSLPTISPDFYPTLVELSGMKRHKNLPSAFDGASLAPVLLGQSSTLEREAIYWHYPHYHAEGATPYSAIRKGDWKLIEFLEDGRVELYNLASDIGEKTDLGISESRKRDELRADLAAWRKRVGAQMPTLNPDYDPAKAAEFRLGAAL